jgi:hypothetical protein|tara:strand:+ start:1031 stop:1213 length:183 start_codon:yes stop_codon:yes gene_type:complete
VSTAKESLSRLEAHERECAIRYQYIERRLDEGSAKFKKLESLLWGVYPFIVGTVVLAKYF